MKSNLEKSLKIVVKAIEQLDVSSRYNGTNVFGGEAESAMFDKARKNLVEILFSNGYEIGRTPTGKYKLLKSTQQRKL